MNCSPTAAALKRDFYCLLEPPPELRLSEWAEKNIVLPEGSRARPGSYRSWPYMVEILDAMADPAVERITFLKSARVGFTKSLMVMMGAVAANDPSPIILLVPTDEDARGIAVDEVEPIFEATPALHGLIKKGRNDGRNTLTRKALAGGASIKILSARAPRKLRRHDCRVLLIDEADAMEVTSEGDPIAIAEKRTLAQAGRKIIVGSTPTEEGVSVVERLYSESDQRVYEVPCPSCGAFHEIAWENIVCEVEHDPTTAKYLCQSCGTFVEERNKPWMVANGRWRATRPEVANHRGYRINALVSLLVNATWPQLMAEWFRAKRGGPAEQQPFINQVLGRTWKTSINTVDADVLRARVEPFGLPTATRPKVIIPLPVLLITVGADVQDDRIEASILGWPRTGAPYVLGHVTFDGNTLDDEVWSEFDTWLRAAKWRNERGWRMGIDAVAVDSGGREGRTQKIYNWCHARHSRRIYAVKGVSGPRRLWERAKKVKGDMRLVNVAVDVAKTTVLDMIAREPLPGEVSGERDPQAIRFSDSLPDEWFEQVTNERRRLRYRGNRPTYVFELARPGLPNEALDCCVYAYAVRFAPSVLSIDLAERERREPDPEDVAGKPKVPRKSVAEWAAEFARL